MGQRLASAANDEDLTRKGSSRAKSQAQNEFEIKLIIKDIRKLLANIEDAVPLISLAITTSGASLSTNLPATISPSRLLQASTFLTAGDTQYSMSSSREVQIGPTFTLSMYMLFSGHIRPQTEADMRDNTWKEVIHKARVKLIRLPLDAVYDLPGTPSYPRAGGTSVNGTDLPHLNGYFTDHLEADVRADEFAYQMIIIEDLDDGRVHSFEENEAQPGRYGDVEIAGIREAMPIHEISKIFYADTGKILNIGSDGESNSPVLLLKRDVNAIPPRRMMERFSDEEEQEYLGDGYSHINGTFSLENANATQSQIDLQIDRDHRSSSLVPTSEPDLPKHNPQSEPWRIPLDLDPEWIAFEVYTEAEDSDDESEAEPPASQPPTFSRAPSLDPQMTAALSQFHINDTTSPTTGQPRQLVPTSPTGTSTPPQPSIPSIRTSLSLLETLLRLLSLQQFQQTSHLSIPDELLNFFLSESATTGAAQGNDQERKRLRSAARRRVGFDPYDESPVRRHGEEYQYRGGPSQAGEDQNYQHYAESPGSSNYDRYDEYQSQGYGSPRYDEGYDTHRFYSPQHPHASVEGPTSETPPLLLKNRSHSSRAGTPERSTPPLPSSSNSGPRGYSSPSTPSRDMIGKGRPQALRRGDPKTSTMKRGSPLARPGTGITDEGLGTSPESVGEGKEG